MAVSTGNETGPVVVALAARMRHWRLPGTFDSGAAAAVAVAHFGDAFTLSVLHR